MAMATGGLFSSSALQLMMLILCPVCYLARSLGQVVGVSGSGALLQTVLTRELRNRIHDPNAAGIIERIRCLRLLRLYPIISITITPQAFNRIYREAGSSTESGSHRVMGICPARHLHRPNSDSSLDATFLPPRRGKAIDMIEVGRLLGGCLIEAEILR
jgi:hypothetical protein